MKARMEITRYSVVNDDLIEDTSVTVVDVHRRGNWLYVGDGPQSMPFDHIPDAIRRGSWLAQSGTRPVKADGHWGGRNYPEMRFYADELQRIWSELNDGVTEGDLSEHP